MAFPSDEDGGGGGADPLMLGPYIDIAVSVIIGLLRLLCNAEARM